MAHFTWAIQGKKHRALWMARASRAMTMVSSFGAAPISAASFSNSAFARGLARWWRSAKIISFFCVCSNPVNSVTRTL